MDPGEIASYAVNGVTILLGGAMVYSYVDNTFLNPPQNALIASAGFDPSITSGLMYIDGKEKFDFYTHQELFKRRDRFLEQLITTADSMSSIEIIKKAMKDEPPEGNNWFITGSGTRVSFRDDQYILTNEHVVDNLGDEIKSKIHRSKELDIALIPIDLSNNYNNLDLSEKPMELKRTDLEEGQGVYFQSIGTDSYYKLTAELYGEKTPEDFYLRLSTGSINPFNVDLAAKFPGMSGSCLVKEDDNSQIIGVIYRGGLNPLFYPNIFLVRFTSINDIVDFAEATIQS